MSWRRFIAAVFLVVVQLSTLLLLMPECSAESISTTYQGINHHKRHFNQEDYHLLDVEKKASIRSSLADDDSHKKSTSEINKLIPRIRLGSQEQDNTVAKDENSIKSAVQSFNNQGQADAKQLNQDLLIPTATNSPVYKTVHRQLDVEDILNEMAHKDPTEWSALDWVVLIMFLTMICWIYSCLCALCCCGRGRGGGGGGSTLLNWLCFYEICCRDGRDLDVCCDYANAAIV